MKAHVRQARTMLHRVKESERLWNDLDRLAAKRRLGERTGTALWDAAMGARAAGRIKPSLMNPGTR